MNKAKRLLMNVGMSIGSQLVMLFLAFVIPRIIILSYGSDTNGATATITQIFTYLTRLEAGISQATRNKLFKPIKENNREEISYWLSVSRLYFRKISLIYFLIVLAMTFTLPAILKTNVDYWSVAFYIFFEGLTSVVSFCFINTWVAFLTANGNMYVVNSLTLLNKTLCYGVKIILALMGVSIALIQVGFFFVAVLQVTLYFLYMRKKFRWINFSVKTKDAVLPDRGSYILVEIAWTIFSSTDMILLSIFTSTAAASVYSVYNMPFAALNGLLNAVYCSLSYNLGMAFHESLEKYRKVHDLFNSFFMGGMTILLSVAYVMIIPFIKLYTRGVTDCDYIYPSLPFLFCLVQFLSWSRMVSGNLFGVSSKIRSIILISVVEALVNLTASILLVQRFGIVGVLIATVIALPLKVVYCNYVADRVILKRSLFRTISILGVNGGFLVAVALINPWLNLQITSYLSFALYGVALLGVAAVVVGGLNIVVNRDLLQIKTLVYAKKRSKA